MFPRRSTALACLRDPACAAYQDFLTVRKDADPDILLLIAGKTEYAKL
jgi:hypothetical protein